MIKAAASAIAVLAVAWGSCVAFAPDSRAASVGASVRIVILPSAPSNLTASPASGSSILLLWTNNASNNTGFAIERESGSSGFSQIATVGPSIAQYTDNGPVPNVAYSYRVAAFNNDGFSPYSNIATATIVAVIPPSGGGGGGGGVAVAGGGGYAPSASEAQASFEGLAYPMSAVSLLENGQIIATTTADANAKFSFSVANITPGANNFTVSTVDPNGTPSLPQTFRISMTAGANTMVSSIVFPPTITTDRIEVKKGDPVIFSGYALPGSKVTITVHSAAILTAETSSDANGAWTYTFDTAALAYGDHTAIASAATDAGMAMLSELLAFSVGDANVAAPAIHPGVLRGDLNHDGRVNLIDFSIMAYWYGKPDPPAYVDFSGDGKVDLTDFSILAYYWTG